MIGKKVDSIQQEAADSPTKFKTKFAISLPLCDVNSILDYYQGPNEL